MAQLTIEKPSKTEGRRVTPRPDASGAELIGITDKKRPITGKDVWEFVRKHAGNQEHNVEIVPLPNVAFDAPSPLPFTKMDREGRRSKIMWAVVNGVGAEKDRRLSTFLREALQHGGSKVRCADLVAALNGGYSESSKSWGTPFVKLRVIKPTE
jgi:hypothetical protein